jgi:hypothetical protein
LKPYTTLRRKPPAPVRCHGSPVRPGDGVERGGVLRRLLGEGERLLAAGDAGARRPVHVEVRLHLAPLLGEEHGQQEAGPELLAEEGEQPRATGRPMRPELTPVLRQQTAQTST